MKLLTLGILCLVLVGCVSSVSGYIDIDSKFNSMVDELDNYDGAMVVSYDTLTGEITGKRKAGEIKEAGVMSISQDAYDINKEGWPEGTLAISRDMSPSQILKYAGGND